MRLPNKLFTYEQSIISQFPAVLDVLCSAPNQTMKVTQLYRNSKEGLERPQDFIDILDSLFYVGKIRIIEVGFEKEISYVERN